MSEIDSAATQPVPAPIRATADALTQVRRARELTHEAGEWAAGVPALLPDDATKREVASAVMLIHEGEQELENIARRLRKRLAVLMIGKERATQKPRRADDDE